VGLLFEKKKDALQISALIHYQEGFPFGNSWPFHLRAREGFVEYPPLHVNHHTEHQTQDPRKTPAQKPTIFQNPNPQTASTQ
jgi:hypothetical protein